PDRHHAHRARPLAHRGRARHRQDLAGRGAARSFGVSFRRIQFTNDLLPSDILGLSVYDPKSGSFDFKPGPV
ncbi:AAA family ATPase, partial [Vibrio parahaemolyticus]